MPTTPKYALRYPASTDTADIPRDVGNLATDVDNLLGTNVAAAATPPASPVDGQLWAYVADATNGVVWVFRYRAASGSAYKWEFIGGPPALVTVPTSETTTTTNTWLDLATVGPQMTVARAGDYISRCVASVRHSTAGGLVGISVLGGSVRGSSFDVVSYVATDPMIIGGPALHAGVAAAAVFKLQYQNYSAGTLTAAGRNLEVLPVRVS